MTMVVGSQICRLDPATPGAAHQSSPQHARTRTFLQRVLNPAAANIGEVPDTGPFPHVDDEPTPQLPHPHGPGT